MTARTAPAGDPPALRRPSLPRAPAFVAAGVDPTAGTWASRMTEGPKPMAAAALAFDGRILRLAALARCRSNADLWRFCRASRARLLGVDGPCGTSGLALRPGGRGWDPGRRGGVRDAEAALAGEGLSLFWTTAATVARFDGAARWIARSLRLFAGRPLRGLVRMEVYPHGAFTVLWKALGGRGRLPAKGTRAGRRARLALLEALVRDLSPGDLPDHDAVDAAAAALVAALRRLRLARSVGTVRGGGRIWLPDGAAIARVARACPPPPARA